MERQKLSEFIKTSSTEYTHVFFHHFGLRGVYSVKSGTTKYFEMNDPNFKNPAKLLAISGMNAQLFVMIKEDSFIVTDMYYTDGSRFFTKEEITKYCTGFKWSYK